MGFHGSIGLTAMAPQLSSDWSPWELGNAPWAPHGLLFLNSPKVSGHSLRSPLEILIMIISHRYFHIFPCYFHDMSIYWWLAMLPVADVPCSIATPMDFRHRRPPPAAAQLVAVQGPRASPESHRPWPAETAEPIFAVKATEIWWYLSTGWLIVVNSG